MVMTYTYLITKKNRTRGMVWLRSWLAATFLESILISIDWSYWNNVTATIIQSTTIAMVFIGIIFNRKELIQKIKDKLKLK